MEGYIALGIIVGGTIALLFWVSLIIWTYRDIRDRTRDLAMQILSVFLVMGFTPVGLLLYLIMRPRETLDEAYARSLEEEALLREIGEDSACPSCRRFIEKQFAYCPYCQTRLREPCASCGQPLNFSWTACPQCGISRLVAPLRAAAERTEAAPAAPAPAPQSPKKSEVAEEPASVPDAATQSDAATQPGAAEPRAAAPARRRRSSKAREIVEEAAEMPGDATPSGTAEVPRYQP